MFLNFAAKNMNKYVRNVRTLTQFSVRRITTNKNRFCVSRKDNSRKKNLFFFLFHPVRNGLLIQIELGRVNH